MKQWIILDRDGVINKDSPEYIKGPDEWHPIENSLEAIALLNKKGYSIAVATNQSGLSRGFYTETTLAQIHDKMTTEAIKAGGLIQGVFYCPHGPQDLCDCRKPLPGLLHQIAQQYHLDLTAVRFVGDSYRDIEAARNANAIPILVLSGNGAKTLKNHKADLNDCAIYQNLWDFAEDQPDLSHE